MRERASRILSALGGISATIAESDASVGGGAFPTARIPSVALSIAGDAAAIESRLRLGDPPVIARIADGAVLIDVRTIFPVEDEQVVAAVHAATS